jgi:dihydrofolate synthase/folylpolyglutamate synthase
MNIESALQKLFSLHQFGIKLGLENIQRLLERIGNPHKNLKSFHIAGSNGKGSTSSFLASILMEAGYKVGLYTSPHFVIFNERIRINGKMIPDDYILKFISELDEYIENNKPTFFELTTAMAFKYFDEQKVDYAVIETGLGGRLDSTNVLNPIASIITSISLEHTQILGDTIEKIAIEKAGIIKNNIVVIVGNMPEEALSVITKKSIAMDCINYETRNFVTEKKIGIKVDLKTGSFDISSTPLRGYHQAFNAALAVKSLNATIGVDNEKIFSDGINNVIRNTGIQGRYEIINEYPKIIFDSAHNPEGVKAFIKEFSADFENYSHRILIFSALNDKNISGMLCELKPYFHEIMLSKISIDRSATIDELQTAALANKINAQTVEDPTNFIFKFKENPGKNCLVVLGSMYLLGEIKSKLLKKKT